MIPKEQTLTNGSPKKDKISDIFAVEEPTSGSNKTTKNAAEDAEIPEWMKRTITQLQKADIVSLNRREEITQGSEEKILKLIRTRQQKRELISLVGVGEDKEGVEERVKAIVEGSGSRQRKEGEGEEAEFDINRVFITKEEVKPSRSLSRALSRTIETVNTNPNTANADVKLKRRTQRNTDARSPNKKRKRIFDSEEAVVDSEDEYDPYGGNMKLSQKSRTSTRTSTPKKPLARAKSSPIPLTERQTSASTSIQEPTPPLTRRSSRGRKPVVYNLDSDDEYEPEFKTKKRRTETEETKAEAETAPALPTLTTNMIPFALPPRQISPVTPITTTQSNPRPQVLHASTLMMPSPTASPIAIQTQTQTLTQPQAQTTTQTHTQTPPPTQITTLLMQTQTPSQTQTTTQTSATEEPPTAKPEHWTISNLKHCPEKELPYMFPLLTDMSANPDKEWLPKTPNLFCRETENSKSFQKQSFGLGDHVSAAANGFPPVGVWFDLPIADIIVPEDDMKVLLVFSQFLIL